MVIFRIHQELELAAFLDNNFGVERCIRGRDLRRRHEPGQIVVIIPPIAARTARRRDHAIVVVKTHHELAIQIQPIVRHHDRDII